LNAQPPLPSSAPGSPASHSPFSPPAQPSWRRSRYGFAAFWCAFLLVAWTLLRVVLYVVFKPDTASFGDAVHVFLAGLHRDFLVALLATLPMLFWFWMVPEASFGKRWHRAFFLGVSFLVVFGTIFLLFIEFFFFEEFKSRFNTVAVDYLLYPYEVFVNIWESYHVGLFLLICLALTVAWLFAAHKLFARMWDTPFSRKSRFSHVAVVVVVAALLLPTIRLKGTNATADRTLNEVANNGSISFVAAAWTHHLDYGAFYKTLPRKEAYARTRKLLKEPQTEFVTEGDTTLRRVAGDPARPKLNVVIFLEESFGSEFWGCLGRTNSLTPEMDKLAAEDGLLFTNLYANGNRTVRGMEGVLSSFPSLPGDSIVKRDLSDNVETIARVLKRDGYSTVFLYGGRGVFDGMRSYAVRNGYERFIEQKHFAKPTFTTAWGVCDEDLMNRAVDEFRDLAKTGKPFCATLLSVSNHKPYTYPKGRIPEDPDKQWRLHAVKYSDYALGVFFAKAKKESFWTNTIFAVVADHGARVYGKQSIPIHSYEIPLLIAGPAVVKTPARIPQLGCSLDVSPTILGLLGRPYETLFFGRDLLRTKPEDGRVLLGHNRDIGMLSGERLVVLGLMKTDEFYEGDPKKVDVSILKNPTEADRELEKDAIAIYQVADDLYTHRRYAIDPQTATKP
jgi:phosphoglycerol transferase MdoB-like AlkP superfamily enzyme